MGARERARLRRRLLGLAALLPLVSTAPAHAERPLNSAGVGVFLGYAWGSQKGLEWGIEATGTHFLLGDASCFSKRRGGLGPVLRLSALGVSRLSLTGALHGGAEAARSFVAIDGELGATLAVSSEGSQGSFHTGALLESIMFNVYARQEWLLPSYSVGGGARYLPTFGSPGFCEAGRPFRGHQGAPQPAGVRSDGAFDSQSPDASRWAKRAGEECASVPAFLQLAAELLELDAPTSLVERALAAAEEELRHTWLAAGLASRFGGAPVRTLAPSFVPRPALPRPLALARLARESWLDGCHNEGLAALLAQVEASETGDAEEARVSQIIASDEAGHAALGFDVLRWIRSQAPELVHRLPTLPKQTPATAMDSPLPCSTLLAIAHENSRLCQTRLAELQG